MFFPPPVWPCFDISYIAYIFMRCFDLFLSHMIMVLFRGPMLSYESKTWILWLPFVTCERFYWKIVTLILIIQFTSAVASSSNSKFEKKSKSKVCHVFLLQDFTYGSSNSKFLLFNKFIDSFIYKFMSFLLSQNFLNLYHGLDNWRNLQMFWK